MNLPANVSTARLPASYEAAKAALAECVRIDECKDWADKAEALASYARQADDETLMKQAIRVRDRAIRRAGELLKQIEPATGAHLKSAGGHTLSRKQAASDAGMSRHQMHTALRVANVPASDFEAQVESDKPPTLSALASQGIKPKPRQPVPLNGRSPDDFNKCLHFLGDMEHVVKLLEAFRLDVIAPALTDDERTKARGLVSRIDAAADRIATRI